MTNLVVADSELQVTGDDTGLLVVTGSVTGQLENFGGEILENSGEVDGGTGTNTLSVVTLPQETVDTTDGESETSLSRAAKEKDQLVSYSKFKSSYRCKVNIGNPESQDRISNPKFKSEMNVACQSWTLKFDFWIQV